MTDLFMDIINTSGSQVIPGFLALCLVLLQLSQADRLQKAETGTESHSKRARYQLPEQALNERRY